MLNIELLLNLAYFFIDVVDEVSISLEFVKLTFNHRYFLDDIVRDNGVSYYLSHLFLVGTVTLLAWSQQVTNLYLLSKFLYKSFQRLNLLLRLQVSLVEYVNRSIKLAYFMGVEILHKLLKVITNLQICNKFSHFDNLYRR